MPLGAKLSARGGMSPFRQRVDGTPTGKAAPDRGLKGYANYRVCPALHLKGFGDCVVLPRVVLLGVRSSNASKQRRCKHQAVGRKNASLPTRGFPGFRSLLCNAKEFHSTRFALRCGRCFAMQKAMEPFSGLPTRRKKKANGRRLELERGAEEAVSRRAELLCYSRIPKHVLYPAATERKDAWLLRSQAGDYSEKHTAAGSCRYEPAGRACVVSAYEKIRVGFVELACFSGFFQPSSDAFPRIMRYLCYESLDFPVSFFGPPDTLRVDNTQ